MLPRELANLVCDTLQRNGFQALLAGGCVRDTLLGRPAADYDVATDATPEQVLSLFPEGVSVGARFGVIVVPRDGLKVEVATFRSDVGYSDGRHPNSVVYSRTPQEDVQRRDFTINGMLMRHDSGEVLDFVGGKADLNAGVIRAIGEPDRRFSEDKLRMLRAVRFAARFGYAIDAGTLESIRNHAAEIPQVSCERIREELTKLLTEGGARRAFELLDETKLLKPILPEVAAYQGVEQPRQFHPEGDVWVHTLMMLEGLRAGCEAALAWGVLLHDVGKPATFRSAEQTDDRIRFDGHVEVGITMSEAICRRLRFSNEETEQIISLVANHMRFKDATHMRTATLKRFVRLPRFDEHMELHRLDCLCSNGSTESYDFVRRFLAETPAEEVRPPRLLTGDDLIELGMRPGPEFSTILQAVEDGQLEGKIPDREAAVEFVRRNYVREGSVGG